MGSARTRAWRRAQRDRVIAKRTALIHQYPSQWHYVESKTLIGPGQLDKTKGIPPQNVFARTCSCKVWKQLNRRADKLVRAQQLRMPYPQREWDSLLDDAANP